MTTKDQRRKAEIQRGLEQKEFLLMKDEAERWFIETIPWWRRWWIRFWVTPIFRFRVRHLRVGQEVFAFVSMKSGWGKIEKVIEEGGRRWGYVIEFEDAAYPDTMVIATGTYCIPLAHVVELERPSPETADAIVQAVEESREGR